MKILDFESFGQITMQTLSSKCAAAVVAWYGDLNTFILAKKNTSVELGLSNKGAESMS